MLILALAACGSSVSDSDGDGISDDDEVADGTNPDLADTDGDGLDDGREKELGTDPNSQDTDGDGIPDGLEVEFGSDPTDPADDSCAGEVAEASEGKAGADVILVIDTSGSMGGEADQVEARINNDLAARMEAGGVDYRIIMLADFGQPDGADDTDPTLCIGPPLSSQDCAANPLPNKPVGGDRFFHYDTMVESRDSLTVMLDEFDDAAGDEGARSGAGQYLGGWGTLLRENSIKFFMEISDDNANSAATDFDTQLRAKYAAMYSNADPLKYVFHSIIGVVANANGTAWPPSEPIQNATCGDGAENQGAVYQELSRSTNGLRFPLCNNDNFNEIFNAVADDVVDGVLLPCSFDPDPTGQGTISLDDSIMVYKPGSDDIFERFNQVDSMADCVDGAFYIEDEIFELCPATCNRVTQDTAGKITIRVGCRIVVP